MSIPTTATVDLFKLTHVSSLYEYIIVYELTENYSFICIMKICRFSEIMIKNADNTLSYTICVIFSDSLSHDTVSVHLYQEHIIQFIMRRWMELLNCQLHPLTHKEELQPSGNVCLSVT
jgi:hypothetical protein